jgi:Uma2 family endonuclease
MASAVLPRQQKRTEVIYPSRDGKPVAETDIHFAELVALNQILSEYYSANPDVYVASNNLFYYKEGDPKSRFSPDVYVVFGVPKRQRRVYLLWEEKQVPSVIFEVSSRGTNQEDHSTKYDRYASLGVKEYFLYDPENDYLKPPLQGYRLTNAGYSPIVPNANGRLLSAEMQLEFGLNSFMRFEMFDAETHVRIPRVLEVARMAEEKARVAKETVRLAEERSIHDTEARKKAEAEVAQLRAELERLRKS